MAGYRLVRYHDSSAFARRVEPFLLDSEAAHCLQLGLLDGIVAGEWQDPFLAVVEGAEVPALVAIRTPPHNLLLSQAKDVNTLGPLITELQQESTRETGAAGLSGVLGPAPVADAFAGLWASSQVRVQPQLRYRQGIYRLERVNAIAGVSGRPRRATEADRRLVERWVQGFLEEGLPGKPGNARDATDRWLGSELRELWLWETGREAGENGTRPASMAGVGGRTRNGIRISMVYTPPEYRRHGYATALVANLSQRQLDSGRKFCFLFTNLANPTSNHIYREIGYHRVTDAHEYSFEARHNEDASSLLD